MSEDPSSESKPVPTAAEIDPAGLAIVRYPDPVLTRRAEPVAEVNEHLRAVAERMIQLMRQADGIGLAAPQVGLPWRMFVCDVPGDASEGPGRDGTKGAEVYINPTLDRPKMPMETADEGCLSLPDLTGEVRRPEGIGIRYTDLEGASRSDTGTGLLARCWQHEFDHLDGVLIFHRFTQAERKRHAGRIAELEAGR